MFGLGYLDLAKSTCRGRRCVIPGCPIDVLTMADTVELRKQGDGWMHRFPSEVTEHAARQSVSLPPQRWYLVPSSNVELVRHQCGVTGCRCILLFRLAILCWTMFLDSSSPSGSMGISLGYKG